MGHAAGGGSVEQQSAMEQQPESGMGEISAREQQSAMGQAATDGGHGVEQQSAMEQAAALGQQSAMGQAAADSDVEQ